MGAEVKGKGKWKVKVDGLDCSNGRYWRVQVAMHDIFKFPESDSREYNYREHVANMA